MNFKVELKSAHHSRSGTITFNADEEKRLATPLCLLYTVSGSVPHLTMDVLRKVTTDDLPTVLPLPSVYGFREALSEFERGLGQYVALGSNNPLYICNQDPGVLTPTGFNTKKQMSAWSHSGKSSVDAEKFSRFIEDCKPQWYQALSDGDTPKGCSKKRTSNSVRYSLELLDKCVELRSQSHLLKEAWMFGSVQGAFDIKARQFSAKHTASRDVDGFVIEGFHCMGPDVVQMQFTEIKELVDEVVKFLPENKPRIMHGAFNPLFILEAVEAGVDVFDASFPHVVAEKGSALVFPFTDENQERRLEISLREEIYREDFAPILERCACYTCRNFKRAYVNHLLVTSEMLGPVLITIHNLHHFLEFFRTIRNSMKSDLSRLKERLKSLKMAEM